MLDNFKSLNNCANELSSGLWPSSMFLVPTELLSGILFLCWLMRKLTPCTDWPVTGCIIESIGNLSFLKLFSWFPVSWCKSLNACCEVGSFDRAASWAEPTSQLHDFPFCSHRQMWCLHLHLIDSEWTSFGHVRIQIECWLMPDEQFQSVEIFSQLFRF